MNSGDFAVIPAAVELAFQGNLSVQRTQEMNITIIAKYHDGSNFLNVTQTQGGVTDANGNAHDLSFNSTLDAFVGHSKISVDGTLSTWRISANVTDIYGNKAKGEYTIRIIPAELHFIVSQPVSIERTLILNLTAHITYPDNSPVGPNIVKNSGLNVTISIGNSTIIRPMSYNDTTASWNGAYRLPQNATLGDYSAALNVTDLYGNSGQFSGISKVVPATFKITVPQPAGNSLRQIPPLTQINVQVHVRYPNGSALTPRVSGVSSRLLLRTHLEHSVYQ